MFEIPPWSKLKVHPFKYLIIFTAAKWLHGRCPSGWWGRSPVLWRCGHQEARRKSQKCRSASLSRRAIGKYQRILKIWVFPKIVGFPPKSSILIGFSIINHPFWSTPILGNTHIAEMSKQPKRPTAKILIDGQASESLRVGRTLLLFNVSFKGEKSM